MDDAVASAGWAKWAFVHGMLAWGVPVGLVTYAGEVWFLEKEGGTFDFLVHMGVFMAGGVVYGSLVKWWVDRKRAAAAKP